MNQQRPTPLDLTDIAARRRRLQADIQQSQQRIHQLSNSLFTRPEPTNRIQSFFSSAEKAVAIYDGALLGYKLIRRFHSIFTQLPHRKKSHKA